MADSLAAELFVALAAHPRDPEVWAPILGTLAVTDPLAAATAVGLAGTDCGPEPWHLLLAAFITYGRSEWADLVLEVAMERFPGDPTLGLLAAASAMDAGSTALARAAVAASLVEEPGSPDTWLARAILARGREARRTSLRTAATLGAGEARLARVVALVSVAPT